jgi:PAS domain S-box-containing protein
MSDFPLPHTAETDPPAETLPGVSAPTEAPAEALAERLSQLLAAQQPALQQALQVTAWLCAADLIAYYQVSPTRPRFELAAVCGEASPLPPELPPAALTRLPAAHLWMPHERPPSELHRLARSQHLTFVAGALVGEPPAWVGWLALAGRQPRPPAVALPALQLLARHLAANLQAQQQRQAIEQQLAQQRQQCARQSLLFDALRDGVIYLAPGGQVEAMNAYAEQLLGYASREVRGQPIEHVLIGCDVLAKNLETTRQLCYAQDIDEVRLYHRSGQTFQAGLRLQPLFVAGEPMGWAILLQDLSHEAQSRIRIQQLEQRALLGEVTAIFAHEVRNPINNISTGLQLMAMNLPADAPEQPALQRMLQDCDRLSELMKAVLAFARPQEYQFESLAVEPFLRRLLERWHPRLARASISYELHVETALPPIQADPRALEQVFSNLIHNAQQAMHENGGKLVLRVRHSHTEHGARCVEISVADSGPGIPDDLRERIFEPFFTTKSGGTGLGLAITRQIVTAHRGLIRVTSIPGGTAFQVSLPAAA